MQKNFTVFLIKLLLYIIVLYLLYSFVKHSIPEKFYFENTLYLFVFFSLLPLFFISGCFTVLQKAAGALFPFI